jgi:hypothetical protein
VMRDIIAGSYYEPPVMSLYCAKGKLVS